MASFNFEDGDSDFSDSDDELEITGWIDEEEPEEPVRPVKVVAPPPPKIDVVHKPPYIVNHLDLFYALCELEDWDFEKFPDEQQEEIMKTLVIENFKAGDKIITEGDIGNDLYFVVATEETASFAEIEVVNQNQIAGTEVFLTRLHRGQYFGQKFFLTRRANKRGATVRVPVDVTCIVQIAKLTQEHFDKWDSFRNLLLVKTVPLIQKLPRKERSQILQNLVVRDFKDGEYIIRQGEKGEDFYIIQEGSVRVVERRPSPDRGDPIEVTLVTLREGHFFGEMSLVTDEPRVASVISIKNTICLCLSKAVFRSALSDETFNEVLQEVLSKRKEIRKQREKETEDTSNPASPNPFLTSPSGRKMSMRDRKMSSHGEVNITTELKTKKLETGDRLINKYIIVKEIGKGAFGEVYLCKDQETTIEYAMKMIARPNASTWNDEASNAIRQEIAVMKRLKHENIVALHEVIDDQNARKIYLIQEYMQGGALMPDAESCPSLEVHIARKYFRDILRGVCYLHSEGIVHRDIKPQNMLLTENGTVKIADFGAAVFTGGNAEQKVAFGGTPAFMAPELFNSFNSSAIDFTKSFGIDIFALGATLYYMVTGRPPWMARNQIELATMIKNIELSFPNIIDPHLKHLLKQMLAKDYRTRCSLDAVVVDDWVTNEGSDPLFAVDPYFQEEFTDFETFLLSEEPAFVAPLKILIVNESPVIRRMLFYQISNAQTSMVTNANSAEAAIEIMESTMKTHPQCNFDYIFFELLLPDAETSLAAIRKIRQDLGFGGIIIGMTTSKDNMDQFLQADGVYAIVRRPISDRELNLLLSKQDFASFSNDINTHGAPPVDKLTAEEVEHAITFNGGFSRLLSTKSFHTVSFQDRDDRDNGMMTPLMRQSSMDIDVDEDGNFDFENGGNNQSNNRIKAVFSDDQSIEESVDSNKLKLDSRQSLSRTRGFMVVPYGTSYDSTDSDPAMLFDRPLKIYNLKEESRRQKREQAMRNSKLAHQYREAKRTGDQTGIHSSKSLLNLYRLQSRKSLMLERKQTRSSNNTNEDDSRNSSPSVANLSLGAKSCSMHNMDAYIGTTPLKEGEYDEDLSDEDCDQEEDDHLESSDDSDDDDIILDSSSSDLGDNDDFGIGADEIQHLDDEGLDAVFAELIPKKEMNEKAELQEWNHIMVGVDFSNRLTPQPDNFTNKKLGIQIAQSESISSRSYMEDRSYVNLNESNREDVDLTPLAMFAVFDGHNGDYVAQFLQDKYCKTFQALLVETETYFGQVSNPNSLPPSLNTSAVMPPIPPIHGHHHSQHHLHATQSTLASHYESCIAQIFERTNALLDREILEKDYQRQQKNLKGPPVGIQDMQTFAGSVGVVAAIMPVHNFLSTNHLKSSAISNRTSSNAIQVFISHVGDCRAVLSHDGQAVQLTDDHKASNKTEKHRIENAGGWVQNGRVNGALGVSRSFGDIQFKSFAHCQNSSTTGDENDQDGLWGVHQQVISKPEFKHFIIENTYEFMILASDGLWDVFSCQEAVNFVRKKLLLTKDVKKTADLLIEKAIARGTQDNTSVIICAFNQFQ